VTDDQERTVLLTDRWPDDSIERGVLEEAGFRLVTGAPDPAPAATIEALVAEHQPAAILTWLRCPLPPSRRRRRYASSPGWASAWITSP
jgi:hypothetical protein